MSFGFSDNANILSTEVVKNFNKETNANNVKMKGR